MATREDVAQFMATEVANTARQYFENGKSVNWMVRSSSKERYARAIELKNRFDAGDDDAARTTIKVHIANVDDYMKRMEEQPDDIPEKNIVAGMLALGLERLRLDALLAALNN